MLRAWCCCVAKGFVRLRRLRFLLTASPGHSSFPGVVACIPSRSRVTSWSCRSRGKVEARTGWSAFSGALGERASLFDRKPCLLPYGPVGLPSRGIPRRLLVVAVGGGRDRLLRVALASRLCALSLNGRRLRCRTDGCPALVLVGVDGPSSGLFPERAACVTAFPLYPRPAR